jgi:ankyrin repeat protein
MNFLNTIMNEVLKFTNPEVHEKKRMILENICKYGDCEVIGHLINKQQSTSIDKIPEIDTPIDTSLFNTRNHAFGRTPFQYLVRNGHIEALTIVFTYQKHLGKTFLNYTTISNTKWNILHDAAKHGHTEVLELLFKEVPSEILMELLLQQTCFGSTPIHLSLVHGHKAVANRLIQFFNTQLKNWVKILEVHSLVNFKKQNVLQLAVEKRMLDLCHTLFDSIKLAEQKVIAMKLDRQSPVSFLKILNSRDLIHAQLIHHCCVQPNDQMIGLLYRILQFGHYIDSAITGVQKYSSIMQRLIVSKDQVGNTPLHYAMGGNSKFCTLLLFRYYLLTAFYRQQEMKNAPVTKTIAPSYQQQTESAQRRGSRNPMNVNNNANQSAIYVACRKLGIDAMEYILLQYEKHEQDLVAIIHESVDPSDIDNDFLQLIVCSTDEQKQFMEKCLYAIRATKDILTDKSGFSAYTNENSDRIDKIFAQFDNKKNTFS